MTRTARRRVHRQRLQHALPHAGGSSASATPTCAASGAPTARTRRSAAALARDARRRRREARTRRSPTWSPTRRSTRSGSAARTTRASRTSRRSSTRSSAGNGTLTGIACEKPLARNVAEAKRVRELVSARRAARRRTSRTSSSRRRSRRGETLLWARGAATTGRPYLARAAEEHSGPHMPWFWQGDAAGRRRAQRHDVPLGARRAAPAHASRASRSRTVQPGARHGAHREPQVDAPRVREAAARERWARTSTTRRAPSEDFASVTIEFETSDGHTRDRRGDARRGASSAPGCDCRPSCSAPSTRCRGTRSTAGLKLFFSREVQGTAGEDLVEKQNAEIGPDAGRRRAKRSRTATRRRTGTSCARSSARRSRGSRSTTASESCRC